jgi:hypothetical protein
MRDAEGKIRVYGRGLQGSRVGVKCMYRVGAITACQHGHKREVGLHGFRYRML